MRKRPSRARRVGTAVAALALALVAMNASAGLFEKLFGRSNPAEPLPPEKAFHVQAKAVDARTVMTTISPAPEHYIYKRTVQFALRDVEGARLGAVALPTGIRKKDPFFGDIEVYTNPFQVILPIERHTGVRATFTVIASYQGCNERLGICYPPTQTSIVVSIP